MQKPRVLIVEDDASWQENFKEAIDALDYATQVTGSYQEADATLDRQHFHLVLIDLRLGERADELEGMRLLQKVAGLAEGTNTIIVSGYADATIATEALKRYDAFYVIEKTKIEPEQFIELVQAAVSQANERYRTTFASAIDFLRGASDLHPWAAGVLQATVGPDRTLGLRDLNQLRDLLNDLLTGLYPLLYHRAQQDVSADPDAGVVHARLWSKALGEPILLKFGRRETIDREVEEGDASPETLQRRGLVRRVRACSAADLGGIVYVLADTPFEDFASV